MKERQIKGEVEGWKKDETPYLIFNCSKCEQFSYVKTTQKTKKCLRCNRTHQVKNLLGLKTGIIVNGISNAVEQIKSKQCELGLKEAHNVLELRSENDFQVMGPPTGVQKTILENHVSEEDDYNTSFRKLLVQLGQSYDKFPKYAINLLIGEFKIPDNKVNFLVKGFVKEGILKPLKDNYFKLNLN